MVKLKEILDAAGAWPEGLKRSAKKAELVAAVREAMMPTGGGHDAAPTPSLDESPTDHEPSVTAGATAVSDEDPVEVLMDMREPGQWYSLARGMRREVHLHVGPTNSGKTYSAIQRLKASESGVYCSPLRLLAWEVAEGLNNEHGVPCDMITGQEKKPVSGARHVACTVEMADTRRVVDVAVIDEAHLMGRPRPRVRVHQGDPRSAREGASPVRRPGDGPAGAKGHRGGRRRAHRAQVHAAAAAEGAG
jgi:hypothetical protein